MPALPPDRSASHQSAPGSGEPGARPSQLRRPGPAPRAGQARPPAPARAPRPPRRSEGGERRRPACLPPETSPLPDLTAVRLFRIPESAPPYDGEAPGAARPRRMRRGATGAASPDQAAPRDADPGHADPAHAGRRPAPGAAPTPPWPSHFAQVLAETLAGARPARQMAPWTTERVRGRIQRLGPRMSTGQRPVVRKVIASQPASGVVEMTVVVGFGATVRALAVRLEETPAATRTGARAHSPTRWMCTAVEAA